MGVYDFWKGECPYCGEQIDADKSGNQYGDIQTKLFLHCSDYRECFRTFKPGDTLPCFFAERTIIVIGESVCCDQPVVAVIEGNKLLRYAQLQEFAGINIPNPDKERRKEMYAEVEKNLLERGINVKFDV
jgi:hypothetical protein